MWYKGAHSKEDPIRITVDRQRMQQKIHPKGTFIAHIPKFAYNFNSVYIERF